MSDMLDDFLSDLERRGSLDPFDDDDSLPLLGQPIRNLFKKAPMPLKPLFRNARIVGSSFRDDHAKAIYAQLKVGDAVDFQLEPTNEHDAFAVMVLADGVHVGYIGREMSAVLYATGIGEHIQACVSEVGAKGSVMVTVGLVDGEDA